MPADDPVSGGLTAAAMLLMGRATIGGSASEVLIAFALANLCATGSWIAAHPSFSELYPRHLRANGIGFAVAFGRLGAAIAPPLLVAAAPHFSIAVAFGVLTSFWLLSALAVVPWSIWGMEGKTGCSKPWRRNGLSGSYG